MSNCDEFRERLWPLDRPRGVVDGEAEARAHLDECAACQAFFERDAMVSRALASRGVAAPTPLSVRDRVVETLDRERTRRAVLPTPGRERGLAMVTRGGLWVAAAAVAGLMFGLSRPSFDVEGAYAQDFLSRAVEADAVEQPDVQAVTAFFMRELGVPVTPVVLASNPISRAMICLIDGDRAAMVEYEMDGYTLAHYTVPRENGRMPSRSPGVTDENGVCVYRWSDDRFEHALVSDMPEDRLVAIAEAHFNATSP
ncbi:MAG: hypothetical protein ACC682_13075 [Gemmatimonadota bacterium]